MKNWLLVLCITLLTGSPSGAADITYATKATGGKFYAADANEVKDAVNSKVGNWITAKVYTANTQAVVHGGKLYICTSSHTSGASTEPGVGASWATVWTIGTITAEERALYDNAQPSLGTVGAAGNYLVEESGLGVHGLDIPGTWKLFYTDGSGGGLKEFSIGTIGTYLKSNGTGGAPTFETPIETPSTLPLTADTAISEAQLLANKFITNQAAAGEIDITLPAVSYHITRTIIVEEAQIVEVNPPTGETFDLSGTILTANYCIDSPATSGAKAVFTRMQTAAGSWIWSVDEVRGDWVDTGVSD